VTEITGALGNPLPYNLITLSSVIIIVPFSGSSPDTASHLSPTSISDLKPGVFMIIFSNSGTY
jgi:hypothetical protein